MLDKGTPLRQNMSVPVQGSLLSVAMMGSHVVPATLPLDVEIFCFSPTTAPLGAPSGAPVGKWRKYATYVSWCVPRRGPPCRLLVPITAPAPFMVAKVPTTLAPSSHPALRLQITQTWSAWTPTTSPTCESHSHPLVHSSPFTSLPLSSLLVVLHAALSPRVYHTVHHIHA